MKTIKLILIGVGLFFASQTQAQISVNIHLGKAPMWGPAENTQVRYYYLPDIEAYYDIQSEMFIFYSGNRWIRSTYLPRQYRNYDLYNGYKVIMTDYRGNKPYIYYKEHKTKYAKGYRDHDQRTIGQRPEHKKYKSKHHKNDSNDDDHN